MLGVAFRNSYFGQGISFSRPFMMVSRSCMMRRYRITSTRQLLENWQMEWRGQPNRNHNDETTKTKYKKKKKEAAHVTLNYLQMQYTQSFRRPI